MLKKIILFVLIFFSISDSFFSQNFLFRVGVHNLFDNKEFEDFSLRHSGTEAETHLQTTVGLGLNQRHHIFAGVDMQHKWGSKIFLNKIKPIIYYRFFIPKLEFYMGAFHKKQLLGKYPNNMFSDSIYWEQPIINGFFFEYHNIKSYFNFWCDWTGHRDGIIHESFYVGWSGRYQKGIFYAQHFGYMFHFLTTDVNDYKIINPNQDIPYWYENNYAGVKDNIKTITSIGIDLADKTVFDRLSTEIGFSFSFETERGRKQKYIPMGMIWENIIEYRGLEFKNLLYLGQRQQRFYDYYGNAMYWGDLMYKNRIYNRTDFIIHFYKSNVLNIKIDVALHFIDKKLYTQQLLTASFDMDNFQNRRVDKKYKYIWDKWF